VCVIAKALVEIALCWCWSALFPINASEQFLKLQYFLRILKVGEFCVATELLSAENLFPQKTSRLYPQRPSRRNHCC